MSALVLHVRLHDGRYHGEGDWPPSPARLFQALVAGAGLGGALGGTERKALKWLEKQTPPIIAAPLAWQPRRGILFYMPNNDSDSIGGDPARMAKIRTATKIFRPHFFEAEVPFVYAWPLSAAAEDNGFAQTICELAESLYQFGRGIDMAWAWGEILEGPRLDELLANYPGRVFRPSAGNSTTTLPSPCEGSLESIEQRYQACRKRFRYAKDGKAIKVIFRQPPRPRFRLVPYDSAPSRQVYELRDPVADAAFAPWPLTRVSSLVVRLRDAAVARLNAAMPNRRADIERVLVGRKPDGTNDGPPEQRVRIIPLPSIGHVHADREIRRVLVEVPSTCQIAPADVDWAFSGLDVVDLDTGEVLAVLTRANDPFLHHYGINDEGVYRVWRTVTPAALPENARRRRIDPARKREEAKVGSERAREQAQASAAVCQALRHAGVRTGVEAIRVQREPFDSNEAWAEPFTVGTRFAKERLWHVEVAFEAPVSGPLVIGDGRFLGLGVMAPVAQIKGIYAFRADVDQQGVDPVKACRALRRAVMARAQRVLGDRPLPIFFTGHDSDESAVRSQAHPHLAFAFESDKARFLVIAPHVLNHRESTQEERKNLQVLEDVLTDFTELRISKDCVARMIRTTVQNSDPVITLSRTWISKTPYVVTRHAKRGNAFEAILQDIAMECRRLELPIPVIEIRNAKGASGIGLIGEAILKFKIAVPGPLLLGRMRHFGLGLFVPWNP